MAEAYKRGLLPPDMKDAYEEAQRRGLVGGGAPADVPEDDLGFDIDSVINEAVAQIPGGYEAWRKKNQTPADVSRQKKADPWYDPWSVGNKAQLQAWFRDPPAGKATNLSDGVELTYVP